MTRLAPGEITGTQKAALLLIQIVHNSADPQPEEAMYAPHPI